MKIICTIAMLFSLACFTVVKAEPTLASTLNGRLVSVQNKRFLGYDAKQLADTKYFAVYFSAQWCPYCREFTPKLVAFYNKIKPQHPEFEIIFMSRDQDENAMREYMATDNMPWPAVKFYRVADTKNLAKYAGKGIPCLVFIDANGQVLSDSYVNGEYVGPDKVLKDIEATLK